MFTKGMTGRFANVMGVVFGVTVLTQAFAFFRQILTASYFGVSRSLDIYFLVSGMTTVFILTFSTIFDAVSISRLVRAKEDTGEEGFRALAGSLFTFSLVLGVTIAVVYLLILFPSVKIIAAGFSMQNQREAYIVGLWFIPWVVLVFPYFALSAYHKSSKNYATAFSAELTASVVATIALLANHAKPTSLAVAMFFGYFAAFCLLLASAIPGLNLLKSPISVRLRPIFRDAGHLVGANQIGTVTSFIERFFQSYLYPGGISSLTYSSQLVSSVSNLLNFREVFVVPLSSSVGRSEKLERLLIGLCVLTTPIMIFVALNSYHIVDVLWGRGKFDSDAVRATSGVLAVYALGTLPSVIGVPINRMFQLTDRTRFLWIFNAAMLVSVVILCSIFVWGMKLNAVGMAIAIVSNSYIMTGFSIYVLCFRFGHRFDIYRVAKYLLYSICASLISVSVTARVISSDQPTFLSLVAASLVYFALIGLWYLPLGKALKKLIFA